MLNNCTPPPRRLCLKCVLYLAMAVLATTFIPIKSYGQQQNGQRLSVSFKDKSLSYVFDFISSHSEYSVSYTNEVRQSQDKVTVSFENATVENAVQNILAKTPFTYSVNGKQIRVFRMTTSKGSYTVTGMVKDTEGMAVPNATIRVQGKSEGTVADSEGRFTLNTSSESGELSVSAISFGRATAKFKTGIPVEVTLKEEGQQLGEVAVIAYGTRTRRDMLGSVSSLKGDELANVPSASLETLLQGKMAGVGVSNLSGQPGGTGSQIVIRGYSSLNTAGVNDGSPLFVVDGVPVQSSSTYTGGINPLSSLDPENIESVEVLKDATSASLYGSRAGNGVILITTKKGKSGKAVFNASFSQSFSWLPATPTQLSGRGERMMNILLAQNQRVGEYDWMTDRVKFPTSYGDTWGWDQYSSGAYDYFWNRGNVATDDYTKIPSLIQDSLNTFYNNSTNWWKYTFRVGHITKGDVSVSGGNDNVRYMVSGGIYDEKGIMLNSSFMRASMMSNLDFRVTPNVDAYTRISMSYTDQKAGSMSKVQGMTVDPKGQSTVLPGKGSIAEEVAMLSLRGIKGTNSNYNIRLSGGFNWKIIKGLALSINAALDHYMTNVNSFTPDYLSSKNLSRSEGQNIGMTMLQSENYFTWKHSFSELHNVELMGGFSYNRDQLNSIGGSAYGGPTNQIHYVGEEWPQLRQNEYGLYEALQSYRSNKEVQEMASFFGRAAYNYNHRYLAEFSIRTDGSSVFGSNVRWATFPSVGFGWVFSDEAFMKDLWWLSFGKFRASWGRSGQKFQEAYLALGSMTSSNTFLGSSGLVPALLANNELTWEKSDQYDFGLDLQLFNYRVQAKLDYYYKYSKALLMQTSTPGNFFLADKMWNNSSAISNEGIELQLSADIIKGKAWQWNFGFNISHDKNMFRKAYNGEDLSDKVLGRPVYGIYTYHDEGIVQDESQIPYYYNQSGKLVPLSFNSENYPLRVGGRKIKDQNQDGIIDLNDKYYAGSTLPTAYGGITSKVTWNNFSLDVMFNYVIRRKMMNMVKNSAFNFTKSFGTIMADPSEYTFWQKPGDNADYPSLEFSDQGYVGQFDGDIDSNIENVNFLRLKSVTLSYDMPSKWFNNKIKKLTVYVTGQNLFLLSNYSGLDPEVVNPYTGKDDGTQYPLNRSVTFGLNLQF